MSPIEMQDRMIDLQNRLRYAESQAAEWKEDSLKWRELYRKAIAHDGRIIERLKEPMDRKRFEQAPCYRCGYNGENYYQPSTHFCATFYHLKEASHE